MIPAEDINYATEPLLNCIFEEIYSVNKKNYKCERKSINKTLIF